MSNRQPSPSRGRGSGRNARGRDAPQSVQVHRGSGMPFGYVPAYLPGSASLVEELNQRVMIVLRDGKHIVGTLASYDQFSNMILQETYERRIVSSGGICFYHDIPLGVYIVRGDSMVLMGQLNATKEQMIMRQVGLDELEEIQQKEKEAAGTTAEPLQWDFDTDLIA